MGKMNDILRMQKLKNKGTKKNSGTHRSNFSLLCSLDQYHNNISCFAIQTSDKIYSVTTLWVLTTVEDVTF
ncbi:hypothetical protein IV64_GL002166 [Lactiplantibacillus xiangfangensis]|uniref:Uncharacterized protein n=2 Tax=Lactiplantibacillus xiangfangensis TaxID=942150 RepID=A0A0R2MI02_9LACO|nr:hypothetical protein IV64_GL002166 [Lactiplantibacillus xiangfangensis]